METVQVILASVFSAAILVLIAKVIGHKQAAQLALLLRRFSRHFCKQNEG